MNAQKPRVGIATHNLGAIRQIMSDLNLHGVRMRMGHSPDLNSREDRNELVQNYIDTGGINRYAGSHEIVADT